MVTISSKKLYEQDYYLWLETTAKLLRERQFTHVDLDNLIEEIESMGRSEKKELKSQLVILLMHLLKWKYQPSRRSESWLSTINEQRRQINFSLEDSPSLKSYYQDIFDKCYKIARKDAAQETGLSIETFPCEFSFEREVAIDPNFLLE